MMHMHLASGVTASKALTYALVSETLVFLQV